MKLEESVKAIERVENANAERARRVPDGQGPRLCRHVGASSIPHVKLPGCLSTRLLVPGGSHL